MLQQTQVDRVLPKYHEWLAKYPTLLSLAEAPEGDVATTWRPLGYNIRPKRLQWIAREAVERFGGALPSDEQTLLSFKGLGRYTVGAIRSFAFRQRAASEPGADITEGFLRQAASGQGFQCFVSAINVGEVYYRLYRTRGTKADTFWEEAWQGLVPLTIVTPTPHQIHQAARLKGRYLYGVADAFAAQLAQEKHLPLVSGDPELQALGDRRGTHTDLASPVSCGNAFNAATPPPAVAPAEEPAARPPSPQSSTGACTIFDAIPPPMLPCLQVEFTVSQEVIYGNSG